MLTLKTASTRRAKRRDKLARWVITLGGITVIASVAAILALIVGVTVPLFRTPRANVVSTCRLPESLPQDKVLRLGIDMDIGGSDLTGFVWSESGIVAWVDLRTGELLGQDRPPPPAGDAKSTLHHVESLGTGKYSLWWSSGVVSLVEIVAQRAYRKDTRTARYAIRSVASLPVNKKQEAQQVFVRRSDTGAITRAARLSNAIISIFRQVVTESLLGDEETSIYEDILREDIIAHICAMTMDHEGNTLYAGTDDGRLIRWQLDEKGEVANREVVRAFTDGRAITALALVLGDVSLATGDAKGELTIWSPVNADGTRKLRAIHRLQPHRSAIREILPSGRKKSILSLDEDGIINLDHMTSERHLVSIAPEQSHPLRQVSCC